MFNNKYFIGVSKGGYHVTMPIVGPVSDDDMLEVAALVIAMKPVLREKFLAILARVESGE
jgi:hypothetical protein